MNTTQQLLSDTGRRMARIHTTEAGQTVVDIYAVSGSFSAWTRRIPATPETAEQVALEAFTDDDALSA